MKKKIIMLVALLMSLLSLNVYAAGYVMPGEEQQHEGTWLIWPHKYTYGEEYSQELENIWLDMTIALHTGENVHIIAYNEEEKSKIENLLIKNDVNMKKIDFVIAKSDDVWVRDTGPIFVFDQNKNLTIANFTFDGWGKKMKHKNDQLIPEKVASIKKMPIVNIPNLVLEGGSVELDGHGTVMGTLSAVASKNRNSNLTIKEVEEYLKKYLGVTNFIWLKGVTDEDITDAHIDGMARFYDDKTILTVSRKDFRELYEGIDMNDYKIMQNAKNAKGEQYSIIELPLTKKNVDGLDYKGSYLNFYMGNEVILLPIYEDANDKVAIKIISDLYPNKKIVPIVISDLFQHGGMIHCVTQQQPISK